MSCRRERHVRIAAVAGEVVEVCHSCLEAHSQALHTVAEVVLAGTAVVVGHLHSRTEAAEERVSRTAVEGTVAVEDIHCSHIEAADCHTAAEVDLADCGSLGLGRTTS